MDSYPIILFLHIVGALGFFVALGLEWASVHALRRALSTQQVAEWLGIAAGSNRLGFPSMLLLLASGLHMMAFVWGGAAWILVALGTIVLLAVLTMTLGRRRMGAIKQALNADGALGPESAPSPALASVLHDPWLWTAMQTRIALALGIVYLMTVKPDLSGSLIAIGIALIVGLLLALPVVAQRQSEATLATSPLTE